ncbi:MAG: efflux RND transporter periplasmic adaptor subunit [Candidatus Eisenbacteria bacterium]
MKKVWVAVALLVLAAPVVWFVFLRKHEAADTYRFVTVEKGDVVSTVSCTGNLEATQTVDVGTQVSGQVSNLYADFNDHVKKGQLLARIDPTILEQEVRSAEASVERSQAELDQALRELERNRPLHDQDLITERDWNTVQYQADVARANYKSAEIGLEKARRNLGYSEVRSPIDGIVLGRLVDVGQTVAASLSAPQLFLLAGDLSKMQILASVDESDIGKVFVGQEARFTVQAHADRTFTGQVTQIRLQSAVTENVVSYTVVVELENPDNVLLPGMTATVNLVVAKASDVFKVANAAIRFRPTDAMRAEMRSRREAGSGALAAGRPGGGDAGGGTRGASGAQTSRADAGSAAPSGGDENGAGRRGRDRSEGGDTSGQQGSGRRGGWGGPGGASDRTALWTVQDGQLEVIPVQTGISDGQYTQITSDRLQEGMEVIAAVTSTSSATTSNPFGGGGGSPGGGRFRPGF